MLVGFRKAAKSIYIKTFLIVLAVSFIGWGIGDVFRGRSSHAIATIGGGEASVSYEEYRRYIVQEIDKLQAVSGKILTQEQIEYFNVKNLVLNNLINNKLLKLHIENLGLLVDVDVLKQELLANPGFQDDKGVFDKKKFLTLLQDRGFTEKRYFDALKSEVGTGFLIGTLAETGVVTLPAVEMLYARMNEQRVVDAMVIPAGYVKNDREPQEAELLAFYKEHNRNFIMPEKRSFSYIIFNQHAVSDKVSLTEEALHKAYEERVANYQQPESRVVTQYLFKAKEEADKAYNDLQKGEKKAYGKNASPLGKVTREGLLGVIKETVFSVQKDVYTHPVEGEFGWYIFWVEDIIPPSTLPFDVVKEALRKELEENYRSEAFYQTIDAIEDNIAAGMVLEEIAGKYDFTVQKVDNISRKTSPAEVEALSKVPDRDMVVPLVFQATLREGSPLTLLSDSETYITFRVDAVTPEQARPFEKVRDDVVSQWKGDVRKKKAKEEARRIEKMIKEGKSLESIASGQNMVLKLQQKVKQNDQQAWKDVFPASLIKELYRLKQGEATGVHEREDGALVIARLDTIIAPVPAEHQAGLMAFEKELSNQFVEDLFSQYMMYLRTLYPVSVNYEAVNTAL